MKNSIKKYSIFWPAVFLAPFVICFFLFNLFPILYSFYILLIHITSLVFMSIWWTGVEHAGIEVKGAANGVEVVLGW